LKIVLDTNVFISGVFFTGPPFKILEAWRDDKLKIVISREILDEYYLLKVSGYRGIKIIRPQVFVNRYI
jgi:putative PIN family toxin of toxin-antitoxin system